MWSGSCQSCSCHLTPVVHEEVGSLGRCRNSGDCTQVVEAALQDAQLGINAVDWLLLHQANQRILDSASQRLKVGSGAAT
jgi:3-Oxoacyl-[acyl-carrier-protein (ACP)] synthase III C terminal